MSIPVTQQPLLITAFDPFKDNQSHTHRSIADRLNISEQAALAALERLEGLSLLVCVRDGTDAPSGGAIRGRGESPRPRRRERLTTHSRARTMANRGEASAPHSTFLYRENA